MKSDIDNLPEILVTDASRESHPMHRPTLHGERILLNRDWGKIRRPTITNDDWNDLQKIINLTLPDETRQRIEQYLHIYGGIGSFYSPENTVLVSEILPALERWIRAGNALLRTLKVKNINLDSRVEYLESFDPTLIQKMKSRLPMQFLSSAVQSAIQAGDIVEREIKSRDRNLSIENDLWSAWVCLTARTLHEAGLKVSRASMDKTANGSPFIRGIVKLQSFLPKECQRYNGYESIRVAMQQSLSGMKTMTDRMLIQILGWGLQFPDWRGYPGNLRQGSKDRTVAFEAREKELRRRIAIRHWKPVSRSRLRPSSGA